MLYTEGVATCTAMTISYPGKFGYLLHITPTDGSYKNIGFLTRLFLRDNYTDFVDSVLKSINRYDILQCEKSLLQFGVVATHDASFKNIIHIIKAIIAITQGIKYFILLKNFLNFLILHLKFVLELQKHPLSSGSSIRTF